MALNIDYQEFTSIKIILYSIYLMLKKNTPSLFQSLSYNPTILGIIIISTALLARSFAAIFIKLSETEIGPNATIFNRLWIATIFFWAWEVIITFQKNDDTSKIVNQATNKAPKNYQQQILLILVAAAATASIVCWAWSLTQTSVANSTILRNLTPLFTSVGGWLLLNQKFNCKFVLGMIVAVIGAISIGWDDFYIAQDNLIGDGIALLSALFYAIYLLAIESLQGSLNTTKILLWRCAFGTLFMLPVVMLTEEYIFPSSWQGWLIVIALAIVCQAVGQGLLVYSFKYFSSGLIALFLLLSPIMTALLAWLIFAESLDIFNGVAFVLVLGGIYLAKSS